MGINPIQLCDSWSANKCMPQVQWVWAKRLHELLSTHFQVKVFTHMYGKELHLFKLPI